MGMTSSSNGVSVSYSSPSYSVTYAANPPQSARVGTANIALGAVTGAGAGGLTGTGMIFEDQFATPRSAGAVNGTPAEPGPVTRTVTDTESKLSIADGSLVAAPKATPSYQDPLLKYPSWARAVGRTVLFRCLTTGAASTNNYIGFGNGTFVADQALRIPKSGETIGMYLGVFTDAGIASAGDHFGAVTVRSVGAFYIVKISGLWKLLWVDQSITTNPLYPSLANYRANMTVPFFRLADLPYPFNDDYGLATQRLAGARTAGDTFTHEANCIVGWDVDTLADGQQMVIRKQDDNNYWRIDVAADGSGALQEVVTGSPTSRGTFAAGSIANGQRMVVIADGTTIRVYANNVLKITYASATNFQTCTSGNLGALGTGGAVSDIVSWPRYMSTENGAILDRFSGS